MFRLTPDRLFPSFPRIGIKSKETDSRSGIWKLGSLQTTSSHFCSDVPELTSSLPSYLFIFLIPLFFCRLAAPQGRDSQAWVLISDSTRVMNSSVAIQVFMYVIVMLAFTLCCLKHLEVNGRERGARVSAR